MHPSNVNYKLPLEAEVEAAVHHLLPHLAGGHTQLRTELFKKLRMEAYPMEQLKTPPQREHWLCLVEIVQIIWCTGRPHRRWDGLSC